MRLQNNRLADHPACKRGRLFGENRHYPFRVYSQKHPKWRFSVNADKGGRALDPGSAAFWRVRCGFCARRLPGKNRIAAVFLPATVFAFEAGPDGIELVHGSFYEGRFISQDSGFKVAGACTFHSYAGSCKVCRSDIGDLGVEDNNLEVNTWAEGSLQTGKENGILIEVLSEIGAWFLCMDQPDLFPFLDEVGKDTRTSFPFLMRSARIPRKGRSST